MCCDCIWGNEAGSGAEPSCLCTSSADKQGPRGRWSDYRRLHDELIKLSLSVLKNLVSSFILKTATYSASSLVIT